MNKVMTEEAKKYLTFRLQSPGVTLAGLSADTGLSISTISRATGGAKAVLALPKVRMTTKAASNALTAIRTSTQARSDRRAEKVTKASVRKAA